MAYGEKKAGENYNYGTRYNYNNMDEKFRVYYKETPETLGLIHRAYNYDVSDITCKFVAVVLGVIVLVMMFIYGNPGGGTPGGIVFFLLKYVGCWLLASVALLIINRTVWRKALQKMSDGDGITSYEERSKEGKGALEDMILFFEGHFSSVKDTRTKDILYSQVIRVVETKDVIGIVYQKDMSLYGGPSGMIGFPKKNMVKGKLEDMEKFLLDHCPRVKHGIKKLE